MKNLKKVLAMVLAFACTFSMFAGAKVFEDVPAGSDYSEAVTMLSDLGVIQGKDDGKYHPEDTITRAEACAMIARLMTGDPNVSQYVGAQSFTDVAKGSWKDSAIGYCYINGIVIGVGNNKFEPDRAITDAEFITMVVRAMGYETADMKQNYPYSYMSNAQAVGLLDGTNMVASTDALRGEDAQVIYNALFTDYARGAKEYNTTHGAAAEIYPKLAESVWGLERAAVGTWNEKDDEDATLKYCKAHTWVVIGNDPTDEDRILAYAIDDDSNEVYNDNNKDRLVYSFKYAGDVSSIVGYQVELWGEGTHGEPTWEKGTNDGQYVWSDDWNIKAIKTVKGQAAYDYNASMADSKDDNGTIELGETSLDLDAVAKNADKIADKKNTASDLTTYLTQEKYNGITTTSDKNVEKALNVRDGAQYKLVDWDNDGDIDWVVVSEANYYKVEAVNSSRVTVSSMKDDGDKDEMEETATKVQTWKLGDTTKIGEVKYDFKTEEDLAEGDIIEVTYSIGTDDDKELVTATITKVESATAELDKVATKGTLELTFDGEVKKIAENNDEGDVVVPANPSIYDKFDDEELGTQFALWENRNGFIVYSDYANETVNYLMVLDTGVGSDKTGDRKLATMDVLFADNSVKKDVEVVSDLELTGYYAEDKSGHDARSWDENKVVGNVYKYWQNEDGVITKMEPMFSKDAKYDEDYTYDESADRLKDTDGFVASLEEAKVIFAVTTNYITGSSDLKVDDSKVMAVKQADIPEIDDDAKDTTDDAEILNNIAGTWLAGYTGKTSVNYVAEVNKNGEASAAVLGVENFNKFEDATTKVALVTNVEYDKNGVVTVEAAYEGEVTELTSAEDVDFDDVVYAYADQDYTVGGADTDAGDNVAISKPNGAVKTTLFKGEDLDDYLSNNAAYAEITTNADGKLTKVTFMDVKDGEGNTVVGHYYEVSRSVIGQVKDDMVAYSTDVDYYYADDENLYSVDRLPADTKDLADEVDYYTVKGLPTINGADDKADNYKGEALTVLNGFDGTPKITAETASNLTKSYIDNEFNEADDYNVADLASKIGGDVVAAFAFDESLGEVPTATTVNVEDVKSEIKADAVKAVTETVATWSKIGNGPEVKKAVVSPETKGVSVAVEDNKIKVTVEPNTAASEFTVKLYSDEAAKNKVGETKTIKVVPVDATAITLTAEGQILSDGTGEVVVDASQKLESAPAATVVIKDAKGADVSSKFTADKKLSETGKITINANGAVDAGTYTVSVTKGGYNFNDVTFEVAETKEYTVEFSTAEAGSYTGDVTLKVMIDGQVVATAEGKGYSSKTGVQIAADLAGKLSSTDFQVEIVKGSAGTQNALKFTSAQKLSITTVASATGLKITSK